MTVLSPHRMPRRPQPAVLGIVQAGGQGSRMDVLTRERAKPALPFAGTHQLIDFAMSNLANSGIDDVWVSVQFLASSLDRHLQSGRPWDLDRTRGGYRRIVPEEGGGGATGGFSTGNADDLYRIRDEIRRHGAEHVIVTSADSVFVTDLRVLLAAHLDRDATCTILTAEVDPAEAVHKMVVRVGEDPSPVDGVEGVASRSVTEVEYKPEETEASTVATEVFVYRTEVLLRVLEEIAGEAGCGDGGTGLGDFGEELLPRLVEDGDVIAVPIGSYWKDVGRPEAYLTAHRDLLDGLVDVFDQPGWPVQTEAGSLPPARVRAGAEVADTLVGPGCEVAGTVRRSVLGPEVRVAAGAVVEDCVVLDRVMIGPGAHVASAVVDSGTRVEAGARVGALAGADPAGEEITLVGRDSVVAEGAVVAQGARLEPGTTV